MRAGELRRIARRRRHHQAARHRGHRLHRRRTGFHTAGTSAACREDTGARVWSTCATRTAPAPIASRRQSRSPPAVRERPPSPSPPAIAGGNAPAARSAGNGSRHRQVVRAARRNQDRRRAGDHHVGSRQFRMATNAARSMKMPRRFPTSRTDDSSVGPSGHRHRDDRRDEPRRERPSDRDEVKATSP